MSSQSIVKNLKPIDLTKTDPFNFKIIKITPSQFTAEIEVTENLPCLAGHFPNNPIVPAFILINWVIELIDRVWNITYDSFQVKSTKFKQVVKVGSLLKLSVELSSEQQIHFRYLLADQDCCQGKIHYQCNMTTYQPCIVVPVYNHCQALKVVLENLQTLQLPIILVDDASTDDLDQIINSLRQVAFDFIRRDNNGGKGAAVIDGIRHAKTKGYTHVLTVDADGQHGIQGIKQLLISSKQNPDNLILGQPIFDKSAPLIRVICREISNIICCILTGSFKARDILCGARIYPLAKCYQTLTEKTFGRRMDFDPEIVIRLVRQKVPLTNVALPISYPHDGISHFNYIKDNFLIAKLYIRLLLETFMRK